MVTPWVGVVLNILSSSHIRITSTATCITHRNLSVHSLHAKQQPQDPSSHYLVVSPALLHVPGKTLCYLQCSSFPNRWRCIILMVPIILQTALVQSKFYCLRGRHFKIKSYPPPTTFELKMSLRKDANTSGVGYTI